MKKLLSLILPLSILSAPALAETRSVESKVPANPVSAQDFEIIESSVLEAAKQVCLKDRFSTSITLTLTALENRCVDETFASTMQDIQLLSGPVETGATR